MLFAAGCGGEQQEPAPVPAALQRVVVYSSIDASKMRPLLDRYSAEFNIPVLYINDGESALFAKMHRRGLAEPADLYIGRDAGTLWYAAAESVLRPVRSELLERVVPVEFRDPDVAWFGLSLRARAIVYNLGAVAMDELSDYAALGDSRWLGRLCLSASALPDNRSLLAMLIATNGEREAELAVRRWIRNLAEPPYKDDEQLVQAIEEGRCDVGIANLSVVAGRTARNAAATIAVHLPDRASGGVHVNISGAGVTRHATNPDGARALLEWLLSASAQREFAAVETAFPLADDADIPAVLIPYAGFAVHSLQVTQFGYLAQEAADLAVRAHYR
jgi:iron(III) transport system substrate-binding protein